MTVYVDDVDFVLHVGDCIDVLRGLPAESVHCVVTSPPYWGLRDYGTVGQFGLEATPEEYVARMVDVFREVRRVLRVDGTCWLNLGDSYAANRSYQVSDSKHTAHDFGGSNAASVPDGLKPKDLVGIPWRVAFALQADGWYLRSDIVWSKPNPMPESVTDRPTKAHEYVFLLSRSPRYFFDQEAVREAYEGPWDDRGHRKIERHHLTTPTLAGGLPQHRDAEPGPNGGRNVRSVWQIATQPYPEAHFATFPEELPRRCILAGTSERGCCPECGAPWERIVEVSGGTTGSSWHSHTDDAMRGARATEVGNRRAANAWESGDYQRHTRGWRPTCDCGDEQGVIGQVDTVAHPPIPCVVLDPFLGSGTTAHVARKHGRRSIGIELNEEYARLAADRLQQLSLFAEGVA